VTARNIGAPAVVALVVVVACGGSRGGPGGPAADPPPGNRAPPPVATALEVTEVERGAEMECAKHDLAIRQLARGEVVAAQAIEGECHGACTPEDKAAGQKALDEANAEVAAGETESVLDYNFTDCYFTGAALARLDTVDGQPTALIAGEHTGPHDIPNRYFRIATLRCGHLFLSEEFGATYANSWNATQLVVAPSPHGLIVTARFVPTAPVQELYRVEFDLACTADPVEHVDDAEIAPQP